MCGILGSWTTRPVDPDVAEVALSAIRHRGPDDEGRLVDGNVFLGMRRLAVIDLEGGRQPLKNESGDCAVVMNGEIYNYRELAGGLRRGGHRLATDSDTEVAVHLYEDHGEDVARFLRGMFALAIWDRSRRRLVLARDRFGKKPLFYARTPDGGLVFASELKALRPLLESAGGSWSIRAQGISDYLSLGSVPQPETIFEGVSMLPPGQVMTFDGHDIVLRTYWSLEDSRPSSGSPGRRIGYDEAVERTRELVREAVRIRLRSDVPLGVFLSGGVDSSIIAYEAAAVGGGTLETFTVGVDDPEFDESGVARRTAEALGVRHTVLPLQITPRDTLLELVRHFDQPFSDPSAIPSLAISRLAREHVTVVLTGDGGDEVFAGYRRHLAAHLAAPLDILPQGLARGMARRAAQVLGQMAGERRSRLGFAARWFRGLGMEPSERYLAWTADKLREVDKREAWVGPEVRSTEQWLDGVRPTGLGALDTQAATDIRVNMLSGLLVKMDMATMAHSLEARSPFLDHELAEFVVSLPAAYRLRGRRLKSLLRDGWRDQLSDEVIGGKKRGFEIPLQSWLDGALREPLMDTLGSESARVRNYLDGSLVDGLLEGGALSDRNRPTLLYSLLVLELWLREFESSAAMKESRQAA
jgi:asparagine synthase (glutamine-hydrolysing)